MHEMHGFVLNWRPSPADTRDMSLRNMRVMRGADGTEDDQRGVAADRCAIPDSGDDHGFAGGETVRRRMAGETDRDVT